VKLARYFQKRGRKTAIVCSDTWRPAALRQLEMLAEDYGIPVFGEPEEKDAAKLAREGVAEFREKQYDLVLVDTAGRHKEEKGLIREMQEIAKQVKPNEIILVLDATLGQQARAQASAFKRATEIGSILITKLDGSAKGGGALSACAETGAPIKFIGVGETVDDLERFDPKRFVGRLLGMGDISTLIEKFEEATKEEEMGSDLAAKLDGIVARLDALEARASETQEATELLAEELSAARKQPETKPVAMKARPVNDTTQRGPRHDAKAAAARNIEKYA